MTTKKEINLEGKIGLTLSGGGYRAAAFHLGVIDYLHHINMLDQLKMLSTVSGGTFIGVKYCLSMAKGEHYSVFFQDFYQFLENNNLLSLGLEKLGSGSIEVPSGNVGIAVAMAQVYAETFLKNENGQAYTFAEILHADLPIDEIIFNATEFRYGLAFRFQKSANPRAKIGNYQISINKEEAAKIRLADIVTASSSFPGGFEPFAFPDDFVWPGGKIPEVLKQQFASGPMAMMDGGIYDNQGIQSLLLAEERDPEDLSMFILSDVDQKTDDIYPYPKDDDSQSGLTLNALAGLSLAFIAVLLVSLVMLLNNLFVQELSWYNFFLVFIPLLQVGIVGYTLICARRKINSTLDKIPLIGRAAWKDIKHLTVDQIIDMISLRISSLFAMAGSVFMKRIRGLVYGLIYGDFRQPSRKLANELYGGKRVSNLIYHLKSDEAFSSKLVAAGVALPTSDLRKVCDVAALMPTTLWFDKADQLPSLVAAGQATLCYNLMKYLVRNLGEKPEDFPEDAKALWDKLNADWQQFNEKPSFLLNKE